MDATVLSKFLNHFNVAPARARLSTGTPEQIARRAKDRINDQRRAVVQKVIGYLKYLTSRIIRILLAVHAVS